MMIEIEADKISNSVYASDRVSLPCGNCSKCCQKGENILLTENDDPLSFGEENLSTRIDVNNHYGFGHGAEILVLAKQKNGDCIFLNRATGCTIHDRAPSICRQFDCRQMFLRLSAINREGRRDTFRKSPPSVKEIYKAGKLLNERLSLADAK